MSKTVLMCPPTYFDIEYEINEWMHLDNQVVAEKAAKEWQTLYDVYTKELGWEVQLIEPVKGLPDMVFTANGGLIWNGKVVLPRFRYPQRQGETEKFKAWFEDAGFRDILMPSYNFEGAGDAFVWHDLLFCGYPMRGDVKGHHEVAEFLGLKPISLRQTDPRFYHLDTALTFLGDDTITIYPPAFDDEGLKTIHRLVPNVIEATKDDAYAYGLNAMHDGQNMILSNRPLNLMNVYKKLGFKVYTVEMTEFQKSGGGVKCLTLELS